MQFIEVHPDANEVYPVWTISPNGTTRIILVTETFYERYKVAREEWMLVQQVIDDLVEMNDAFAEIDRAIANERIATAKRIRRDMKLKAAEYEAG